MCSCLTPYYALPHTLIEECLPVYFPFSASTQHKAQNSTAHPSQASVVVSVAFAPQLSAIMPISTGDGTSPSA